MRGETPPVCGVRGADASMQTNTEALLSERRKIRLKLRNRRRALPSWRRQRRALLLPALLLRRFPLRTARRVAAFMANDGELDPAPLMRRAARRKKIYLPVMRRGGIDFVRWRPGCACHRRRHGIPAPRGRSLSPRRLDAALTPLVACDARGNRLGRGFGLYDRKFAFRLGRSAGGRPILLGLGHSLQQLPRIEPLDWDVPLDGLCTERGLHWFRRF